MRDVRVEAAMYRNGALTESLYALMVVSKAAPVDRKEIMREPRQ